MSAFLRYFLTDPTDDVLLNIESANVIDEEPLAPIKAQGTGVVCCVGEFEDGDFNTPQELSGPLDFKNTYGGFGYIYSGVVANNPAARVRYADAAILGEFWNGNGAVALNGKKFFRLICVRVDNRIGDVTFTRLASLVGVAKFTYLLTTGQNIVFNNGGSHTATFTGVAATVTGASASFGSVTVGMTAVLGYDAAPDFTVTFLGTDTTVAAVVARINQYAGFTFASNASGQVQLTGIQAGLGGRVRVTSGSTGTLAAIGLTVAVTNGTGNVQDITKVTIAELHTIVHAASATMWVETMDDGRPRMYFSTTPGSFSITSATAIDFGFAVGVTANSAVGNPGVIPAGTRIKASGLGTHFVTMQTITVTATVQGTVTASGPGPYTVAVRHATDDGTGVGANTATVDTIEHSIVYDAFVVTNPAALTAALTETQLDNAYLTAFAATLDMNTIATQTNIIFSARQSNTIRQALKDNANAATTGGMTARMACIRPPFGTARATALSTSTAPGVGATRDQRVIYNYPGVSMRMRDIAQIGITGGTGFTADGVIDAGSDGFLAALMSLLPPEENPGQDTPFLTSILGIESSANAAGFTMQDYILFKAGGICAPRIDGAQTSYQSGVTSVDPAVNAGLVNISRRRMGDYCQGTSLRIAAKFIKKTNKQGNRVALKGELRAFALSLMGTTNEAQKRIAGFTISDKGTTTPQQLAAGLYRIQLDFRFLGSLDSIALMSQVGENVQVLELAPGETQ